MSRQWRPSPDQLPRKRPYSPPHSPTRTNRMRNAIHYDTLFEQGIYPTFACFSARGSRAISCFKDGFARVWNVDPIHHRFLDCEQVLRHGETVYRAAISDDGTRAITTAGDGVARVWHLSKPNCPSREIGSHYRSTRSCDVSSDGKYVSATFYTGKKAPLSKFQGTVVLYDAENDRELFRNPIPGVPDKVRVSRNGRIVAVGCYGITPARIMAKDTRLTLFNSSGDCVHRFPRCFPEEDSCLAWDLSDDGNYIAICAQNHNVIEVYSQLAREGWESHPLVLRAAAPLLYERVRIVDNGDLVTTLALDQSTKERSILVFRPSTGDVLFSLACGVKDPKACVDIEPRVCYVAASYERAERKVVRLLSRTGGEGASLNLVRCGDPPKNSFHATSSKASSVPTSSLERLLPPARPGEAGIDPSPALRLLEDSPTPPRPQPSSASPSKSQLMSRSPMKVQQMDVSPARLSRKNNSPARSQPMEICRTPEPIKSAILPSDDQFALDKPNDGNTMMEVDAPNKTPSTSHDSPAISNLNENVSPTQQGAKQTDQELSPMEADDTNKEPTRTVQAASGSTLDMNKTLKVSQAENPAPDTRPKLLDRKTQTNELIKEKMQKLRGKSTIPLKRTLSNASSPVNIIATADVKEASIIAEREDASTQKKTEDSAQLRTDSDNHTIDKQGGGQTNEAADLNKPTSESATPKKVNENIVTAGQKADTTDPQNTDSTSPMKETLSVATAIPKKPRWQRKVNKQLPGSKSGREGVNALLIPEGNEQGDQSNQDAEANAKIVADGNTVNGILRNNSSALKGQEPSVAPCHGSLAFSGVQAPVNMAGLLCDNVLKTHTSQAGVVGAKPSVDESKSPSMSSPSNTDNEAKEEAVLSHTNDNSTTQTLKLANCMETRKAEKYEVKEEATSIYKNRYFMALEAAKALFRQASHEVEGVQIVSNVKGFKTMLELLRADIGLIDRKIIARIVYEKGGMKDAINEDSFLEAFSALYTEVQAVRQRLWSEVYDQAGAEEEGLIMFHARDLITRECAALSVELNPIWNNETLDEVIASYSTDGVLVDRNAFVQAADHIFSI